MKIALTNTTAGRRFAALRLLVVTVVAGALVAARPAGARMTVTALTQITSDQADSPTADPGYPAFSADGNALFFRAPIGIDEKAQFFNWTGVGVPALFSPYGSSGSSDPVKNGALIAALDSQAFVNQVALYNPAAKTSQMITNLGTTTTQDPTLPNQLLTGTIQSAVLARASEDGRFVAYETETELVSSLANDQGKPYQGPVMFGLFLYDANTGRTTTIVPPTQGSTLAFGDIEISGDGSTLVYELAPDALAPYTVHRYDIAAGTDAALPDIAVDSIHRTIALSYDGRRLYFNSADDLTHQNSQGMNVFLWSNGQIRQISPPPPVPVDPLDFDHPHDLESFITSPHASSWDGKRVVFVSDVDIGGQGTATLSTLTIPVFVYDEATNSYARITPLDTGVSNFSDQMAYDDVQASLSPDGSLVAFRSHLDTGQNPDRMAQIFVAPTALAAQPPPAHVPPVAANQSLTTSAGTPVVMTLSATASAGAALTYSVVAPPAHGTLSGMAPALAYTPAAGFAGTDSFTFKANDGMADSNIATVSIAVIAPPAPAGGTMVARLAGDVNGDGKVSLADVILELRMAIGLVQPTADQIAAADFNGNGRIDLSDVTVLLRFLVGVIPSLPAGGSGFTPPTSDNGFAPPTSDNGFKPPTSG